MHRYNASSIGTHTLFLWVFFKENNYFDKITKFEWNGVKFFVTIYRLSWAPRNAIVNIMKTLCSTWHPKKWMKIKLYCFLITRMTWTIRAIIVTTFCYWFPVFAVSRKICVLYYFVYCSVVNWWKYQFIDTNAKIRRNKWWK